MIANLSRLVHKVLFEKTEQVLNGEPPQIHSAQVLQRHIFGTRPEQPDGTFVTGCAIVFQKLNAQHRSRDAGKAFEVQFVPGS